MKRKVDRTYKVKGDYTKVMLSVDSTNYLVGKILTATEAIFPDGHQQEAVKKLFLDAIWEWASSYQTGAIPAQMKFMMENGEEISAEEAEKLGIKDSRINS